MNSPFSAVLLAGGKSSRMGRDKAFIEVDGQPLWQCQLRLLESLEPAELFIAGPPRPEWVNVIPDAQPNAGPLGGVVAALRRCSTPFLLVFGIDLPRMTSCYLRSLLSSCSPSAGVVPHREPLVAVYPLTALPIAEECLAFQDYSMQSFARRCVSAELVVEKEIAPEEAPLFLNMNTPEDVLALAHA